ncbi:hypothetical protein B1NLA3E_19945 [Bacillus sp. 1NLA3E]|nr:hypothetical protein B1NLA3E_19945 [Bacillus sp. 1NLA3E]
MTRQFPFYQLSKIISISLIIMFVFSVPFLIRNFRGSDKPIKYLFILNIVSLSILLIYSIVIEHNSVSLAIRFYSVFVLLLSAFFLPPKKIYVNIFVLLAVLHSVLLIGFEIYIVLFGDPEFAGFIRSKVMELGLGDIYTYNQYFYRIQIKGNPILPISFLVSLFAIQSKRLKISAASLLFVGTIVAGNFAFILAILFFLGMYFIILFFSNKKVSVFLKNLFNSRMRILMLVGSIILILFIAVMVLYPYLNELLLLKMEVSIPTRFDQMAQLIENLAETPTSLLFGQGLGNVINVITDYRDYRNNYYFELQTLYVLNQVGILYFLLFLITKIAFVIKFWDNKFIYLIYLSYVLYAFTNPYLFDTTNILVLIVLSSLSKLYFKEGKNSESKI